MKTFVPSSRNGCLLCILALSLVTTGCETMINAAFDAVDYNSRVDRYEDRGYSKREAREAASYDQMLRDMDDDL